MSYKIIRTNGNNVVVLGTLPQGVYATPRGRILITRTECTTPEQAYLLDDISPFVHCLSHGIVLEGTPAVGDAVQRAEEQCGPVGCSAVEPLSSSALFDKRHVAIIAGTGAGKSTLIMRAVERFEEDGKVVVLAYHPDLLELSRLPHVAVVQPRVNLCDLDYQSLYMLLQFHRLSAEPVKMQRYLRTLLPIACRAASELRLPPHEALLLLLRLLVMLEAIEVKCKSQGLLSEGNDGLYCKLRQLLEDSLGKFYYNVIKDLARNRDTDSLNSLLMYAEMAFAQQFLAESSEVLSDKPVTLIDLTPALSLVVGQLEGRLAALLTILFNSKLRAQDSEPLYVVVDEFAALSSVEYIHQVFKLLLMQGRKFGIYLIAAGQPDPSLYDLLPNFHRVILGRIAGARAIKELAVGLPNVPTAVLQTLPTLRPLEMVLIDSDRIVPFRALHPSWRHV